MLNPMLANQDLIPNLAAISVPPSNGILTGQSEISWSVVVR